MVANMISSTRHKKMNECSVHIQDETVNEITARIHKQAKDYYEGPMKHLQVFEYKTSLLFSLPDYPEIEIRKLVL